MMKRIKGLAIAGAAAATLVAGGMAAHAQDAEKAVEYRQGVFQVLLWNIGPLGAMAKGEMDFDAETAEMRAERIATMAGMIVEGFPEGSQTDDSDALAAIWENKDDFASKAEDLEAAAGELAAAAPDMGGPRDLGPMVQAIGQACKACHDDYRAE